MTARETLLGRVRAALADRPASPRAAARAESLPGTPAGDLVELFRERLADYGTTVVVATDPVGALAAALPSGRVRSVVVPADLPPGLTPRGVDVVVDESLTPEALDAIDAAVTTCAWACAETGTIAFDGGAGQGRRALSLIPDLHVCHIRVDQILTGVPELLRRLEPSARAGRAIVLVSGPSATSDIELQRVEGVHGPRTLVVVIDTR